jgi:enamine deaminase RidA (YjgF/YER057c/UK114 family)
LELAIRVKLLYLHGWNSTVGGVKPTTDMREIQRYGNSKRWADVVVHRGVAHWVEVADDISLDARGQIAQVLAQIDATLEMIKSDRTRLLQVLVYITDQNDAGILNELWDAWVPADHPPVRAMVQVGLGKACKVELVVTAATIEP